MNDELRKAALITGGTNGLGKAVAVDLARRGWGLCLHDGASPGEEAARVDDVRAAGDGEVEVVAADLTDGEGRERLVEQALESFGRIDLLVNAAPGASRAAGDLLEVTEDVYREVMDSTLAATFFLTQRVASEMVRLVESGEIEGPRIATLNSISAEATSMDHGPHCLSRSALTMMTRLFADRLGEHGISVYEVRVGLISSGPGDPAHRRYDGLIDQGLTPIRRWGHPADVARAVAAIAEDLLPFSTGEVVHVDGGFHLRRL